MFSYCDSMKCRRQVLLNALGENSHSCGNCDICCEKQEFIDHSVLAQKILSTIYRIKQKFTITQVIDILRGNATSSVQIWEHHKISTFAIASEHTIKEIRRTIRQLYSQNLLDIDFTSGALKLNANSLSILRGLQQVNLKKIYDKSTYLRQNSDVWLRTEQEERLYHDLMNWRHAKAIQNKVSYHAIMSDRTLKDIILQHPTNLAALKIIYGIGLVKLERFGLEIINLIIR